MARDTAGTTVSFDGSSILEVTSLSVNYGDAQSFDVVDMSSTVRGTGVEAVPTVLTLCSSVKSGTITVEGFGQAFGWDQLGKYGTFSISGPGYGTENFNVFLKSSDISGGVNDVWKVSATFQLL